MLVEFTPNFAIGNEPGGDPKIYVFAGVPSFMPIEVGPAAFFPISNKRCIFHICPPYWGSDCLEQAQPYLEVEDNQNSPPTNIHYSSPEAFAKEVVKIAIAPLFEVGLTVHNDNLLNPYIRDISTAFEGNIFSFFSRQQNMMNWSERVVQKISTSCLGKLRKIAMVNTAEHWNQTGAILDYPAFISTSHMTFALHGDIRETVLTMLKRIIRENGREIRGTFIFPGRASQKIIPNFVSEQAGITTRNRGSSWVQYATWISTQYVPHELYSWERRNKSKAMADLKRKREELLKQTECTIGADPELELYRIMKLKSGQIIPNFKNGLESAREVLSAVRNPGNSGVGLDGNPRIVELRPKHDTSPTKVAQGIRRLLKRLAEHTSHDIVPIAGGGFNFSTGGHIHIGNMLFSRIIADGELMRYYLKMMDTFLYLPFKLNNPFATRGWSKHAEIDKEFFHDGFRQSTDTIPDRIITPSEEVIGKLIDKNNLSVEDCFSSYDVRSAWRSKRWGLEYRSLPSFIADYDLTRIVFKLAKHITEYFLQQSIKHETIRFHSPPTKEDYCRFIVPEEYEIFMQYVKGKRKHVLASNVYKNWKIVPPERQIIEYLKLFTEILPENSQVIPMLMERINHYSANHYHQLKTLASTNHCNLRIRLESMDIGFEAAGVDIYDSLMLFAGKTYVLAPTKLWAENRNGFIQLLGFYARQNEGHAVPATHFHAFVKPKTGCQCGQCLVESITGNNDWCCEEEYEKNIKPASYVVPRIMSRIVWAVGRFSDDLALRYTYSPTWLETMHRTFTIFNIQRWISEYRSYGTNTPTSLIREVW